VNHTQAATIRIIAQSGAELTCSARLERDPNFLHWNRIALFGGQQEYLATMRMQREGQLRWELHQNPNWPKGDDSGRRLTSGTGVFRSIGMAMGDSIASDSIQNFSDLEIHGYSDKLQSPRWHSTRVEFRFLQRPTDWFAYPRKYRVRTGLSHSGDWYAVKGTGLKFRLTSTGYPRSDERLSKEVELLDIPGVEISPVEEMSPDDFADRAADLWFSFRILIAFRFRLYATTLAEFREFPGGYEHVWHNVSVEPRRSEGRGDAPPFYGSIDRYFASGTATLARHYAQRASLHAAAFGYANSYESFTLEGRLTSCVEAIEGLVTAFENSAGLGRDIFERKTWKAVSKELKLRVDELGIEGGQSSRLKGWLSSPPSYRLEERILRMVKAQRRRWDESDRGLLASLGDMISVRNKIVHGRLVEDSRDTYAELARARAIFERLFLNFLECRGLHSSGYSQIVLASRARQRMEESASG
jgi:hypothetical protein